MEADEWRRLRWRCRRGVKELDLLLGAYLEQRLCAAAPNRQGAFARLLDLPDPELLELLLGTAATDDRDLAELITEIRATADA